MTVSTLVASLPAQILDLDFLEVLLTIVHYFLHLTFKQLFSLNQLLGSVVLEYLIFIQLFSICLYVVRCNLQCLSGRVEHFLGAVLL